LVLPSLETIIQLSLLIAFQMQPVSVVTVTLPLPPLEGNELDVGAIEYEQP
jgi:hypothetical protein